jgi:hypothetical protein
VLLRLQWQPVFIQPEHSRLALDKPKDRHQGEHCMVRQLFKNGRQPDLVILCHFGQQDTHVIVGNGELVVLAHSCFICRQGPEPQIKDKSNSKNAPLPSVNLQVESF